MPLSIGTHYEANTEMDWEPHPIPRPSAMFPKNSINNGGTMTGSSTSHSHAFIPSASSASPFLFHTSAMQIDEPPRTVEAASIASTSTSSTLTDHPYPESSKSTAAAEAHSRDIANGAVQRERRKRDQLKNWQVAKGKNVQIEEEAFEKDEDDSVDEVETSFMESLSLSAPIKSLLVSTNKSEARDVAPNAHNFPHIASDPVKQTTWRTRACTFKPA